MADYASTVAAYEKQYGVQGYNDLARKRLIATALPSNKNLGSYTGTSGQTIRVKALNNGILTGFTCEFTFTYTVGTATATLSPYSWLNLISRVTLSDYDNTLRINAPLTQLWLSNKIRLKTLQFEDFATSGVLGSATNAYGATSITEPQNTALTAGAQTAVFQVYIPVAFDADGGDLRGAMNMAQTVSDIYLTFDVNPTLYANGDDSKVFNGAATTTITSASVSVAVVQEFWNPVTDPALGIIPIPKLDISTVNEYVGYVDSTNFAAGQEKLITLPNARAIVDVSYLYYNNSLLGGSSSGGNTTTDLSQHTIRLGGTNVPQSWTTRQMYLDQRRNLGGIDLGRGVFFWDWLGWPGAGQQPLQTAIEGQVQLGITPGSGALTTPYVQVCQHNLYPKGAALGAVFNA